MPKNLKPDSWEDENGNDIFIGLSTPFGHEEHGGQGCGMYIDKSIAKIIFIILLIGIMYASYQIYDCDVVQKTSGISQCE